MEWPRIPLPDDAQDLAESAARGREIAALLDPETPVPGVTQAPLRPGLAAIAVPATTSGRNMAGDDFALTAGWGHFGAGGAVMPGQGRVTERGSRLRRPPERRCLLARRPRRGLALQARRLPGAQEMAVLPRTPHPRPRPDARGSPALHRHRKAHRRIAGRIVRVSSMTLSSARLSPYQGTAPGHVAATPPSGATGSAVVRSSR